MKLVTREKGRSRMADAHGTGSGALGGGGAIFGVDGQIDGSEIVGRRFESRARSDPACATVSALFRGQLNEAA